MPSLLSRFLSPDAVARSSVAFRADMVELQLDGVPREFGISLPFQDEELDRFIVWSVKPSTSAESSVREVRDRTTGRALGHIFPVTSMAPQSPFCADRLENKFQKIFASVAIKALVVNGVANHAIVRRLEDLADRAALSDLFDDDLAIVVIGKENLGASDGSAEEVKLLLQGYGYFLDDLPEDYSWTRVKPPLNEGSYTIGRTSPDLTDSVGLFSELICLASRQSSATASVLVYYQIIEVVADKLLGARLRRLAENPPANSWDLKEALAKAVSEKSRVVAMCNQAATGLDAVGFGYLRDSGLIFLRLCNIEIDDGADCGAVLYLVRNTVVHNQSVLNGQAHRALGQFVVDLHNAVFGIIRNFTLGAAL